MNLTEGKYCKIIVEGGKHLLQTPSGEIIPGLIFTRVHDDANSLTTAVVKLFVELEEK